MADGRLCLAYEILTSMAGGHKIQVPVCSNHQYQAYDVNISIE